MKPLRLFAVLLALALTPSSRGEPLKLHPQNSHYFSIGGKPALLITSGEHYGAVLNREFDYVKYLETLAADGLNLTRTFPGCYVEPQGAFNIERNTLAPSAGALLCPWGRSGEAGYVNGGNKFDLTKWDDAFFARLRDFVAQAERRGVVVELNLFTPMYENAQWNYSPMKAANNVNGIGRVGAHEVYTLEKEPALLAAQEAMVRKIVTELNGFDSLYYEVMNEPYFGGVTPAWHDRIADVITDTERALPKKHLISWNVANGSKKIERPHPAISVFNFHYAHPPDAVGENYALGKVIGLNETGFKGTADDHYRMEAWEFLLAGGALYNHLDYSFCVGHEDGTLAISPKTPGGGGVEFRKQIRVLKEFIESFDFLRLQRAAKLLVGPDKPARGQVLAEPGRQYALYIKGQAGVSARLELAAGKYRVDRIAVRTGAVFSSKTIDHPGGACALPGVPDVSELAIRIVRAAE